MSDRPLADVPSPAGGRAPSAAAPFLAVRGVCKRFGAVRALEHIDLEVGGDELLVVLGPTGAGKTTLLRTIAGLEQPDAGSIVMAGSEVTGLSPAARDVALVFQNFSLYPRWTVRENLEFPLRAPGRRVPEAELRRRIEWAAELLNISRYLERAASRLSGGEMQRVAIGRAIVRRPRLFLMDEPLTNLDAKLREALRVELVQLRRQLATPMIFVTHDQAEALSMADRIVVLSEGSSLQTGSPREIYERPLSPLVALQLGQPAINLLRVRRQRGRWLSSGGAPLLAADDAGAAERVLGVRAEHITLDGGEGSSEAVVRIVESTGPTTTLLVDWAGEHVHIVVPRRTTLRPGDRVRPRIDPLGYLQNRTVDWLDHQLAARELLGLDIANTALVIEHEYPRARIQEKARLKPILQGSIAFARKIDEAAACMYALQHEVLPAQDIPVQGRGRVAYWT